jgi:DNA-binding transcriptional ArsR family regulator
LRQNKLVSFRRDGQMTFYALDGAEVRSILMTLHLLYGRDRGTAAAGPLVVAGSPADRAP